MGVGSGTNTAVGLQLCFDGPELGPLSGGLVFDAVEEIHRNGQSTINLNDDVHILTEAWIDADITENWKLRLGRQASHGEVFREDVYRHKSRSLEALVLGYDDGEGLSVSAGHAIRLSNWLQFRNFAEFNDFGAVFGDPLLETDGLTWLEGTHSGWEDWEVAMFGACARFRWQWGNEAGLSGFYRHEKGDWNSLGNSEAFGLAVDGQIGSVDLELGTFSVRGRPLLFQTPTTGLNHPLGALMLICESPFDGGADTAYLKAMCRLESTKFYGLYAFTRHRDLPFEGHEINLVISHDLNEQWNISLKLGYGLRHPDSGGTEQLSQGHPARENIDIKGWYFSEQ